MNFLIANTFTSSLDKLMVSSRVLRRPRSSI